ncbi:MAG: hypothetical protein Q9O62_06675 [Ardenticatenia bacterium]|nr:hypothetical protein [Ardenticatenia bacterium]
MSQRVTLDYIATQAAQRMAEVIGSEIQNHKKVEARDLETLVTKALGVLQNQGVYAMALFLFSRSGSGKQATDMKAEERVATALLSWLWLLRNPQQALAQVQNNEQLQTDISFDRVNSKKKQMLQEFADLSRDLDTLLLVRDLYEQTLIYARYHAKALGG